MTNNDLRHVELKFDFYFSAPDSNPNNALYYKCFVYGQDDFICSQEYFSLVEEVEEGLFFIIIIICDSSVVPRVCFGF